MTSLERLNFIIELVENGVDVDLSFHLQDLKLFKQDLEILKLIIKRKNNIYLRYDYEFLNEKESIMLRNDLKFIENYLAHHKGYIPKCFNKVGDSDE